VRGARRGDARVPPAGRADVRLRQQPAPGREGPGRRGRVRVPGLRPRVHPAAVLRRQGPVPLGRAVGRSEDISRDRPQGQGAVPARRAPHRWLDMAGERIAFQGLPRAHLLARPRRAPSRGLAFNEMVRAAR
jgi:urocanate hydratase